jgi:hypothetical protein
MRKLVVLILCLPACNPNSENAAAKGAKVIEWDASRSTRPAFKTATFDGKATREDVISVKVCADEVKLKLRLETGTAKYTEAGDATRIGAIAALTATVEDGKGFEIVKGACDGPNYQLTAPGTPPGYTILDCHFHGTKPKNECDVMFQLKGDGTLMSN